MNQCLGIDISKDSLNTNLYDGQISENSFQIDTNSIEAVSQIIKHYKLCEQQTLICMEATGNYHLVAMTAFIKKGFKVAVINPVRIKKYAEMKQIRIQTDAIDAILISQYGLEQKPKPIKLKEVWQEEMFSILKMIEVLLNEKTANNNRLHAYKHLAKRQLKLERICIKSNKQRDKEVLILEKRLEELVSLHGKDEMKLAQSIPGVGKRMGTAVLAFFGDFNSWANPNKCVCYVGLCPSLKLSGTSIKQKGKISKQGNKYMRKILYLCSLTAKKYNRQCRDLATRLKAKGKAKKQILIAVASKLLRQIWAVVKSGKPYDPAYGIYGNIG